MTKIKEVWSSRAKAKTWAFDVTLGTKRYRRLGFKSLEHAEAALNDIENVPARIDTLKIDSVGAMAELLVTVDLLRQGFDVYRSVSSNGAFDLIAVSRDCRLCRIEVKSAVMKRGSRRFNRARFDRAKHDVLALVFLRQQEIEYSPGVAEWFDSQYNAKAG